MKLYQRVALGMAVAMATVVGTASAAQAYGLPLNGPDGYVYLYDGTDYTGATIRTLGQYYTMPSGWNDRVSSIINNGYNTGGVQDVIWFQDSQFRGLSYCLTNGTWLDILPYDQNHVSWNNRISSFYWTNC